MTDDPQRHRVRACFAVLLIVLAALLTPVSVVAVWAHDEIGDADRYVDTMQPLAANRAVQGTVTDRVTDAVMRHINVDALLGAVAPADRQELREAIGPPGEPLTTGLRNVVHSAVGSLVAGPAFRTVWSRLNRTTHASVVHALAGSKGKKVTVDLAPVVESAKERLDDSGVTAATKIPEVHARFTVLEPDAVGPARTGFRLVRIAGVWLPVVTLLLAAGGVLLATRRRRALIAAALALAGGALLLDFGLMAFRALYPDRLPDVVPRPAALAVFDALVALVRTGIRMVVVAGGVVALGGWLGGPGSWPTRARAVWTGGIGAARAAAGLRPGPRWVWVSRATTWLNWLVLIGALAVYLLWDSPAPLVTAVIALCAPAVMAVVELLAGDGTEPERRRPAEEPRSV
ncbi:hypothetical protein AB0M87_17095 [Streptomyces sp. NPDC051320]|uniref:hypothetical protein n=1 Tax=Streptomyces sp. NPDC051320 TaxID=3154644 RepID=UPI00341B6C98